MTECYQPGWDEGPNALAPDLPYMCEADGDHTDDHVAFSGTIEEVRWPISWTVDEADAGPVDVTMSMKEDPYGDITRPADA